MRPLMGPQAPADREPSPVPGLAWPEWEVTAFEAGGVPLVTSGQPSALPPSSPTQSG